MIVTRIKAGSGGDTEMQLICDCLHCRSLMPGKWFRDVTHLVDAAMGEGFSILRPSDESIWSEKHYCKKCMKENMG